MTPLTRTFQQKTTPTHPRVVVVMVDPSKLFLRAFPIYSMSAVEFQSRVAGAFPSLRIA